MSLYDTPQAEIRPVLYLSTECSAVKASIAGAPSDPLGVGRSSCGVPIEALTAYSLKTLKQRGEQSHLLPPMPHRRGVGFQGAKPFGQRSDKKSVSAGQLCQQYKNRGNPLGETNENNTSRIKSPA